MRSSSAGDPERSGGLPHSSAGAYPPAALPRSGICKPAGSARPPPKLRNAGLVASATDMAAVLTSRDIAASAAQAGPWRRALRRLLRRRPAMVGLAIVLAFIALALFAPWVAPHDPVATSWGAIRK